MPTVELDDKTTKLFEEIKTLTFLQTAQLVKAFEEEFGISASAPVAVAAAPAGGGAAAAADDEVSEVSVILKSAGDNKINVLKVVREITNLGLKEAKDLVDAAPKEVVTGVKPEQAKEIAEKIKAAGGDVEIK